MIHGSYMHAMVLEHPGEQLKALKLPIPQPGTGELLIKVDGELVPLALRAVGKGGVIVCGGIFMSQIPGFSYELLWGERKLVSVANMTRLDGEEFLELAQRIPVITMVEVFPLEQANEALAALRAGRIQGAGVLVP